MVLPQCCRRTYSCSDSRCPSVVINYCGHAQGKWPAAGRRYISTGIRCWLRQLRCFVSQSSWLSRPDELPSCAQNVV